MTVTQAEQASFRVHLMRWFFSTNLNLLIPIELWESLNTEEKDSLMMHLLTCYPRKARCLRIRYVAGMELGR